MISIPIRLKGNTEINEISKSFGQKLWFLKNIKSTSQKSNVMVL